MNGIHSKKVLMQISKTQSNTTFVHKYVVKI